MPQDDVAIFGAATMRERVRTLKSGATRSRVTLEIEGDSIGIGLDPRAYGKPVAEAMAELVRERIKTIAARAAPATIAARKRAKKALAEGAAWATRRYAGGRLGTRQPDESDRLFNDSGRLAESVAVGARPDEEGFTINVAANRFDPKTFTGGFAKLQAMYQRLLDFVPELREPRLFFDNIGVAKAVREAVTDNVIKVGEKNVAAVRQLMQAKIATFRAGLSALQSLAG